MQLGNDRESSMARRKAFTGTLKRPSISINESKFQLRFQEQSGCSAIFIALFYYWIIDCYTQLHDTKTKFRFLPAWVNISQITEERLTVV